LLFKLESDLASVFCSCGLFMHSVIFQMEEEFVLLRNAFAEALIGDDRIACILRLSRTFCTKYSTYTRDISWETIFLNI